MILAFKATYVACTDTLGGDILQVSFDTVLDDDDNPRCSPYVLISRNFEFPESAAIEWHNGQDYDGGAEIRSITLTRTRIILRLNRELTINMSFQLSNEAYARLTVFLQKIMDDRLVFTE
jgi:hypothetical protein